MLGALAAGAARSHHRAVVVLGIVTLLLTVAAGLDRVGLGAAAAGAMAMARPAAAAEAIETGIPISSNPTWDGLELSLRTGVSEALLGQKTAKQALDGVAQEWQRSLRRAGIIK